MVMTTGNPLAPPVWSCELGAWVGQPWLSDEPGERRLYGTNALARPVWSCRLGDWVPRPSLVA